MTDTSTAPLSGGAPSYGKLVAGTTASLIGGALTTVVVAVINAIDPSYHITDTLQGAIQTLVTICVTAAAIYFTPHGSN